MSRRPSRILYKENIACKYDDDEGKDAAEANPP